VRRLLVILGTLVALTFPAAALSMRVAPACTVDQQAASQQALDSYLARYKRDRAIYFRTHRSAAQRRAYIRRQRAKIRALRRAAECQVDVPPPPPTTPPPSAPAESGHYKGSTSQLTNWEFNVTVANGVFYFADLVTGQINQSCTPPANIFGNELDFRGYGVPIRSDSSFAVDDTYSSFVGSEAATSHLTITGHFNGSIAAGSFQLDTTFADAGTTYRCTSNQQSWTAAKTG
jgi:hypothetical protein